MSTSNSNLDLSKVDDLGELAERIEQFYKADTSVKSALSYHWERNHLFLDGKHWIVYDSKGTNGQWQALSVSRANEYIPRPVTNYTFDVYQTLKSYLIQHRPRSSVVPNTQRRKDKIAAKIAEMVCDAFFSRLQEEKNYEYAAACVITYGTCFKKDYWDPTTLTMAKVPRMQPQPITDPNTGQVVGMTEVPARDPQTGDDLFDEIPLGDVNTCIVEPYRLALDPLATDLHTARWVMEYSIQPLDWIKETYGREGEGYTGRVEELEEEKALSGSMQRFYNLKQSSGVRAGTQLGPSQGQGGEMIENAAVVKEYYERPTRQFPKGRLVVVANSVTLYSGPSPYEGPELGDWHPYSECRWEVVPGRFWGKSPLDDCVEIQKHINSIDAAIILTRKTTAVPQKLIPNNSGVKPGEWTGRPGLEVRYNSTAPAPSTIPPVGVDAQVWQERKQRLEDMKNISGAIDILKGDRPPGVTAASALEMLFEVGTGKLRPALDRWKVFIEGSQKKQLRLVNKYYKEPRPDFIRMLHSKNKGIPEDAINTFIGADLYDNCNVKIEAGSNIPKLQSAEKAQLIQTAQIGTLGLDQPENRREFNRRLGILGFDQDVSPDADRAEAENDMMDDIELSPDNKPVVLADEDHALHKQIHLRRMKEIAFLSESETVQQAYMQHMQEHDHYIQMQQQMEMEQAAATGQPPAPHPTGAQPTPTHPAGKGITSDMQEQLASDIPKRA